MLHRNLTFALAALTLLVSCARTPLPQPPPPQGEATARSAVMDADEDGVPDGVDACPDKPEDEDGFEDEDGCPDEDDDRDGIADAVDLCPREPELVNGFEDSDGCPDPGASLCTDCAAIKTLIVIVLFDTGSSKPGKGQVDMLEEALAQVQGSQDRSLKILEIAGHSSDWGGAIDQEDLARKRAEWTRQWFLDRGIAPERLRVVQHAADRPRVPHSLKDQSFLNDRVEVRASWR